MIIKRIEGFTREPGKPVDWPDEAGKVAGLPIRDVTVDGIPWMISAWEPTEAELKMLQEGHTIKLWIQGTGHPVVAMSVGELVEANEI